MRRKSRYGHLFWCGTGQRKSDLVVILTSRSSRRELKRAEHGPVRNVVPRPLVHGSASVHGSGATAQATPSYGCQASRRLRPERERVTHGQGLDTTAPLRD